MRVASFDLDFWPTLVLSILRFSPPSHPHWVLCRPAKILIFPHLMCVASFDLNFWPTLVLSILRFSPPSRPHRVLCRPAKILIFPDPLTRSPVSCFASMPPAADFPHRLWCSVFATCFVFVSSAGFAWKLCSLNLQKSPFPLVQSRAQFLLPAFLICLPFFTSSLLLSFVVPTFVMLFAGGNRSCF
jgi:hypothetical protein